MSDQDVRTVQDWLAAFNRGDRETAMARLTPDAVLRPPRERMTAGPDEWSGAQGWLDYHAQLDEVLDGVRYEPEEFFALRDGVVLAHVRACGTGRASGAPWDQGVGHLYELVDGRIASLRVFMDRAEAWEAAEAEPPPPG